MLSTTQPIDWSKTRKIYKKLSDEFHVLTEAYNLQLDEETKSALDYLIISIDTIDNYLDQIVEKEEREKLCEATIKSLRNSESHLAKLAPANYYEAVGQLNSNITTLNIKDTFLKSAQDVFHHTEVKRHVTEFDSMIGHIISEGSATAMLPLSIMKLSRETPFGSFFDTLCQIMGLADLIADFKSDYKTGIIKVKPKLTRYFQLIKMVLSRGLKLVWQFPNKWALIKYCMKFGWILLNED